MCTCECRYIVNGIQNKLKLVRSVVLCCVVLCCFVLCCVYIGITSLLQTVTPSPEALHTLRVPRLLYQVVPLTSRDPSLHVFVVQTRLSVPPALSTAHLTLLLNLCVMTLEDDNLYCLLLCLNLIKFTQKFCDRKFPDDGLSCLCG